MEGNMIEEDLEHNEPSSVTGDGKYFKPPNPTISLAITFFFTYTQAYSTLY
jgi:hypothetical protein